METYTPFCGTPPLPGELLSRWTFDPVLLAGLAVACGLIWHLSDGTARRRALGGWALTALLFVSPLCALSMALFSARVAQHLVLTLVAAPLLSVLLPNLRVPPAAAAGLFAGLFWLWHIPGPYALTLQGDLAYWGMHLSLLGAAIIFWASLRGSLQDRPFAVALAVGFTAAQMTALSALLVLSDRLWHPWHALTTAPYGLSAMGDQALAGGLMWVAGGLLVMAAVGMLAFRLVQPGIGTKPSAVPGG